VHVNDSILFFELKLFSAFIISLGLPSYFNSISPIKSNKSVLNFLILFFLIIFEPLSCNFISPGTSFYFELLNLFILFLGCDFDFINTTETYDLI
jgi:hypothetical protein